MGDPIRREGDGVEVTCWTDGWPLSFTIRDGSKGELELFTREKAEGLHYALGKVLEKAPTK